MLNKTNSNAPVMNNEVYEKEYGVKKSMFGKPKDIPLFKYYDTTGITKGLRKQLNNNVKEFGTKIFF